MNVRFSNSRLYFQIENRSYLPIVIMDIKDANQNSLTLTEPIRLVGNSNMDVNGNSQFEIYVKKKGVEIDFSELHFIIESDFLDKEMVVKVNLKK